MGLAHELPQTVIRDEIPPHPLGIKPSGNAYDTTKNLKLKAGLFVLLPDDILLHLLESFNDSSLKLLGYTCKSLYAFSRFEDLWKRLCIEYVSNYLWLSHLNGLSIVRN